MKLKAVIALAALVICAISAQSRAQVINDGRDSYDSSSTWITVTINEAKTESGFCAMQGVPSYRTVTRVCYSQTKVKVILPNGKKEKGVVECAYGDAIGGLGGGLRFNDVIYKFANYDKCMQVASDLQTRVSKDFPATIQLSQTGRHARVETVNIN